MKNAIIFIFFLMLVGEILEMKKETTYEMNEHWEDQTIFQINREEPRAHFFLFESEALALENDKTQSQYFQSLNGEWKFHFAKNPSQKAVGFEVIDHDVNDWENIQVPGHWEMQGWSVPIYLDEEYPFPPNPPFTWILIKFCLISARMRSVFKLSWTVLQTAVRFGILFPRSLSFGALQK